MEALCTSAAITFVPLINDVVGKLKVRTDAPSSEHVDANVVYETVPDKPFL